MSAAGMTTAEPVPGSAHKPAGQVWEIAECANCGGPIAVYLHPSNGSSGWSHVGERNVDAGPFCEGQA